MKIRIGLSLLFSLLMSMSVLSTNLAGLDVSIATENQKVKNNEDVYVRLTVHNTSSQPVQILKWYLPDAFGEIEDNIFKIDVNGSDVDYLGRHYKRPAPTAADYVTFQPNQQKTYRVELSGVYDFTEMGNYQISFEAKNYSLHGVSAMHSGKTGQSKNPMVTMKSNNSAFVFIETARLAKRCNPRKENCDGGGGGGTGDVSFSGACSNSEQSSILSALSAAKTMANSSVSYLNGSAGPRYTTWFGAYSSSRWNTVAGNFDAIKDALDTKPKTFDCSCNQSYYAYVYPSQPYKVYLCRAFWSASTTGTDSKAGTIIHEISHFNVVAGTDDIVYGQTGAKNLAISDPNSAVQNADSHEYFAENTPSQN